MVWWQRREQPAALYCSHGAGFCQRIRFGVRIAWQFARISGGEDDGLGFSREAYGDNSTNTKRGRCRCTFPCLVYGKQKVFEMNVFVVRHVFVVVVHFPCNKIDRFNIMGGANDASAKSRGSHMAGIRISAAPKGKFSTLLEATTLSLAFTNPFVSNHHVFTATS